MRDEAAGSGGRTARAGGREVLVAAENVGVRRDGRWLVRGVDFDIRRGEILTLIGPNGSGKTTTAKAVLGIHAIDEGRVRRVDGLVIGYVPQRLTIDWSLPLDVRRLMTLTGRHAPADIEAALAEVGIAHLADAPVQRLSGGEFQRALLARAILRKPDLLVLDEPLQGVDFTGEIALYQLIGAIRDRLDCGILLISHDLHIVMAATDHVLCLNGHVCCHGTPQSVAESEEYRALFGNRGAAALAVYRHHHDHAHLTGGRVVPAASTAAAIDAATADAGCCGHDHGHHDHSHDDHGHHDQGHDKGRRHD
ncbi:MAG: ATP-binding cassette domain-containing protein [Hyphomicrobiales bacterium]